MFNILIDKVPSTVNIDNVSYDINSDFRTSILFTLLMEDIEIDEDEKLIQALELYYPICPENIEKAIDEMICFYSCGNTYEGDKTQKGKGNSERIYSFDYDADYIYSAFKSQYNVDLQDILYLHWWTFKAMFKSLKEDNEFVKIMSYRSVNINDIEDKKQKEHYKKLKSQYTLPKLIYKDENDKLKEINEILSNGGDISKLL